MSPCCWHIGNLVKKFSRFQGEIVDRLAEVGISVPFNQLDVHIVDQSAT